MKKRFKQAGGIILLFALLSSCSKKEDIEETATTVGQSTIVFFPSIEVKGETLIIISKGATYTDQGATATLNGADAKYTTTGTVNTATPGVYILNYEAKNEQGYSAADYRTVVVIDRDDVKNNDFSGTYDRIITPPNGQTSTWTKKTGVGEYSVENPGGATGLTVTGVNYMGNKITIPKQHTSVGDFASTIGTYFPAGTPPDYSYHWAIINGGYGTAERYFKKR